MYCPRCGRSIPVASKFCSTCGTSITEADSVALTDNQAVPRVDRMATHIKILGWIYLILGILGTLAGLLVVSVLSFLGINFSHMDIPDFPLGLFPLASNLGTLIGGLLLLVSVPGIIAGYGLLNYKSWARTLTIVLSILNLFHIPFGTMIGIYGLWVLLSSEGEQHYRRQATL
jgi:membrane-associated protease RseP (regulator of RpoE activity)